jgi:putative glutamine amidotransferase
MSPSTSHKPRVGIPWRTSEEESQQKMDKLRFYFDRVREAGGEPELISLHLSEEELRKKMQNLDAFVLPGSPADVDPARYGARRLAQTKTLDPNRDTTDLALIAHSLESDKPLLGICYGCQILNVFFSGTLIQDIVTQKPGGLEHGKTDLAVSAVSNDLEHSVHFEPNSRLARLAGISDARINSSHHQSIEKPGRGLIVTARAPDGVVEAVELQSHRDWVVGVQWHPERMPGDPLAKELFEDFVSAAKPHAVVSSNG